METTFKALVRQVTVKGDVTIQLVLDPSDMAEMPTIAKLANQEVLVGITATQRQLDFVEEG